MHDACVKIGCPHDTKHVVKIDNVQMSILFHTHKGRVGKQPLLLLKILIVTHCLLN